MSFYIAIYSNDKYVRSLFRNHSLALIKNCRFRDSDCTLTIYCHLAQTAFTREGVILFQFEYEFLEFWCWNLVPFLPDIGFQLLRIRKMYFLFNNVPKVLYR